MPIKIILNFMTIFYILINTIYANSHIKYLNYQIDGKDYSSYLVKPKGYTKGIIFIIHDWNGLNKHEKSRADMLAEEGYVGVALDLFGVNTKLEGFEDYRRESSFLYQNRKEFRKRIKSGLIEARKILGNLKKQFIIGYCFGGAAVLETARSGEEMTGFVSFHGGLKTPEGQDYSETSGSILILHGSVDPVSNMDDVTNLVKELNDFEIQHEVHIYGGGRHSFTIKGSRDYSENAENKSWDALLNYLKENSKL